MNDEQFNKEATDLIHKQIFESLDEIKRQNISLDKKLSYTNGKVKRLYIGLVALAFYVLGVAGIGIEAIMKLFMAL